ncbi:uncharacterized protein BDZ99DRAFT_525323 [Mytilinidion resinicola]|uniref:Uncharacterized protein n=1 Tax=Mytilinidion resinicola TaxID=574789 RepID=A0A6A6Y823_9PEZI|nr:uncharacterized protein BDZ99DRAFT_525323 [Mytilinidion resinicola]KAF2804991.1 hypothetical protein BDZ99DRAFT_525323 [Mytilinidion resinicola]
MAAATSSASKYLATRCLRMAPSARAFPCALAYTSTASASPCFIERRNPQLDAPKRHYAHSSVKRKDDESGHNPKQAESSKASSTGKEGETTNEGAEDEGIYWNEYLMFGVLAIPATVGIWYLLKPLGILDPFIGVSMIKEMEPKHGNLRETEERSKYN